jgi:hypothetical protein
MLVGKQVLEREWLTRFAEDPPIFLVLQDLSLDDLSLLEAVEAEMCRAAIGGTRPVVRREKACILAESLAQYIKLGLWEKPVAVIIEKAGPLISNRENHCAIRLKGAPVDVFPSVVKGQMRRLDCCGSINRILVSPISEASGHVRGTCFHKKARSMAKR